MQITNGDMFIATVSDDAMCVTTNGIITKDNKLVMGAGIAKTFRDKYNGIDVLLAKYVKQYGNRVFYLGKTNDTKVHLISFPTKHHWKDKSDLKLIEQSCIQLKEVVAKFKITGNIYLPAPGCSNGKLDWEHEVKPIVQYHLKEDKYVICFK